MGEEDVKMVKEGYNVMMAEKVGTHRQKFTAGFFFIDFFLPSCFFTPAFFVLLLLSSLTYC